MSPFTDEDLKRLKQTAELEMPWEREHDKLLLSLLSRLDAAEKCAAMLRSHHAGAHDFCEDDECPTLVAISVWRDSKGSLPSGGSK